MVPESVMMNVLVEVKGPKSETPHRSRCLASFSLKVGQGEMEIIVPTFLHDHFIRGPNGWV